MGKVFLTSDWHIGEDRFELMGRPFRSIEGHNNTLLKNFNSLVAPEDKVYVIGDAVYQKADPAYINFISLFNGHKTLIRGNHDEPFTDEQFAPYFEEIVPHGDGIELSIDDLPLWLTHYPTQSRLDRFNIVGHVHGVYKVQLNLLNVGVDVHHFYPVNLDKVSFYYTAISKYYDKDVWIAYDPVNSDFLGKRGKNSSYYTKSTHLGNREASEIQEEKLRSTR